MSSSHVSGMTLLCLESNILLEYKTPKSRYNGLSLLSLIYIINLIIIIYIINLIIIIYIINYCY